MPGFKAWHFAFREALKTLSDDFLFREICQELL